MKKYFTLIFLFLVVTFSANAQLITVSVGTLNADPGETVYVPVTMVSGAASPDGTPIIGCDLSISYDDNNLDYVNLVNFYPGLPQSEWIYSGLNSSVTCNWIDGLLEAEYVPDGTVLFEIEFVYHGGSNDLVYTIAQFYDYNVENIPTNTINGGIYPNTVLHDVTFTVDMSLQNVASEGVFIAGSFNNYSTSQDQMQSIGNGLYSITMPLEENTNHYYRFVNGNQASGIEIVPNECGILNPGTGVLERFVEVPDQPLTVDTFCFARCVLCPELIDVTFRVDMINEQVSAEGMHLAGTFNNWDYDATEMILQGAGAVYVVTLQLEEGSYHEFKFVNGNDVIDAEIVPDGCAVNGNRYISVPSEDYSTIAFCYSECVECGSLPEYFNVVFRVDMSQQSIHPQGVHIAGNFQGWQPGINPMINTGDNIFEYEIELLEGSNIEYKFVNGNTSAGYEVVPAACSSGGNRFLNGLSQNTIIPLVCFSECDTCVTPRVNVTFRVDMSKEIISPEGVHIAGSFQGFDPASTPMSDAGNKHYEYTLELPAGTTQFFRFVNGNTIDDFENVPVACAVDGNRILVVPANDTILTDFCFSLCETCPVGNDGTILLENGPSLNFDYSSSVLQIKGLNPEKMGYLVKLVNISGQTVYQTRFDCNSNEKEIFLPASQFSSGLYIVTLRDTAGQIIRTHKISVQ